VRGKVLDGAFLAPIVLLRVALCGMLYAVCRSGSGFVLEAVW
jgi:hypothetical protein